MEGLRKREQNQTVVNLRKKPSNYKQQEGDNNTNRMELVHKNQHPSNIQLPGTDTNSTKRLKSKNPCAHSFTIHDLRVHYQG